MYPQEIEFKNIVDEHLIKTESEIYPCHTNRASALGHPCLRYLVFLRTRWEEQKLPTLATIHAFRKGRAYERLWIQTLNEITKFDIREQQRPMDWKKYNITGHIDFANLWSGKNIPTEVKAFEPHTIDKINSIDDFWTHPKHYIQKAPGQLLLYLLMSNEPEGMFLLVGPYSYKPIWLYLNSYLEYAESLIKKAEQINKMVVDKTVPEMIKNELVCDGCSFEHVCLPDRLLGKELTILQDDPEVIEKLDRREELKKSKSEYEELDKELKKKFEKIENGTIGDYRIIGKQNHRDGYSVEASDYWTTQIKKLIK